MLGLTKVNLNAQKRHSQMTKQPIPTLVTSLAIPTTLSQIITIVYNTADTYFISQLGKSAAAAVGVVFSFMSIIQAFGFSIGMGGSSLISRQLGARENKKADSFASSTFAMAVVVGCLLMLLGLGFSRPLMHLLGASESMLPYTLEYAVYIFAGAPIMCSAFVLNMMLRAEGEAAFAMIGLCSGGLLNLFLDPLLIFGLDMGVSGAALATVISQAVSFSILLSFFLTGKSQVTLCWRNISRNAKDYLLIFGTGFPTLCRQSMASIATATINVFARQYGDAAVAAITIANKLYLLVRNLILGIGQGFQPVAGYNFGAKLYGRVRQAFWFAVMLGTSVCTLATIFLLLGSEDVLRWFIKDEEVIILGAQTLRFACCVMPFMAYSTYVNQLYQCLGYRTVATLLALCRQGILFFPMIVFLPPLLGLTGIQLAQPAADCLTFLVSIPFQIVFTHKLRHIDTLYNYMGIGLVQQSTRCSDSP